MIRQIQANNQRWRRIEKQKYLLNNSNEFEEKIEVYIDNLQIVNLKFQNWKLLDKNTIINKIDNKYYFTIWKEYPIKKWKLKMIPLVNEIGIDLINEWIKTQPVYRWDGSNDPKEPTINEETGKIIFWADNEYQNVHSFLLKYINYIVQENIRVQQGGNYG